jgi:hypothetical protein
LVLLWAALWIPSANCLLPPGRTEVRAEVRADAENGILVKDILDRCLGSRWQLVVDSRHPAWPGKLILINSGDGHGSASGGERRSPEFEATAASSATLPVPRDSSDRLSSPALPLVIRSGDRVTVEQNTHVLHALLEAVALESGQVGQRIRVRLISEADAHQGIFGTIISAVVTGAKQARWAEEGRSTP